jgi:replicative DNA helicase
MTERKKIRNDFPAQFPDHGRIPPQAVDLEESVLGCCLLYKDALLAVVDILKPESFYKDAHQIIYEAIQQLYSRFEPVDVLTVISELRKAGKLEQIGGPYYLTQITKIISAANIEYNARIIQQMFINRELIRISHEISLAAYDPATDCFENLEQAETSLMAIGQAGTKKDFTHISKAIRSTITEIETIQQGEFSGIPSGFTDLDRLTCGWQKGNLIIIAARPGMGKTALAMKMARNAAVDFKKPMAIFSLEMSEMELTKRLLSGESDLKHNIFKNGNLRIDEWDQLNFSIKGLIEAPIYIDDTPAMSLFDLRAKSRRMRQRYGVEMILVDYLQLMKGDQKKNGNREQEISSITQGLKALAKELDIPVIALSQLSRAVETRGGGKRPILSDLRESGAIEQDADLVMFIYRPEYYKISEWEDGTPTQGQAEVIIAKHRAGATGECRLKFVPQFVRFDDYVEQIEYQEPDYKF